MVHIARNLPGVESIYLFGSRAFDTGSLRSDIDLLLYSPSILDTVAAQRIQRGIPPLDIFSTYDQKIATSAINRSKIIVRGGLKITDQLSAILLWDERDGLTKAPVKWEQRTRADVTFKMTNADFPSTFSTKIFIGHGRSQEWKKLWDFLRDDLRLDCDEYNSVPVAGVSTFDRLEEMLRDARFAFLVATAENLDAAGLAHARENVVHEIGLFQGRLGASKAIVMLEQDCEEFTNIVGLGQIRFPKGRIEDSFDDVRGVLKRERIVE